MKKRILFVKEELKSKGLYKGIVNDSAGQELTEIINKYPGLDPAWSLKRKVIGCMQLICQENGINPGDIDGYWGPDTEYAYDQLLYLRANKKLPDPWRPEERKDKNPNGWPVQYTNEFNEFYGKRAKNLVRAKLPFPHKLSWNTSQVVNSLYCHQKVHDSLIKVLENVLKIYGQQDISRLRLDYYGGCFNERQIRGGTKWSMHSWAIALDYDPSRNKLKWGRDKAVFAKSEYDAWWKCWEDEGWVSLGRERNFDWMHVQAAKLK